MYIRCILTKKQKRTKIRTEHRKTFGDAYWIIITILRQFQRIFSRGHRIDCSREFKNEKEKKKKERVKERLYVCVKKRENVQWKLQIRFSGCQDAQTWHEFVYNVFSLPRVCVLFSLPVTLHPHHPIPFLSSRNFQIEARWWWNRRGDCHWPSSNLPHEIAARDRSRCSVMGDMPESNGVDRGWLVIDEGRFKMKYFFKRAVARA